jgi:hypothetical protein
MYRHAHSLAAIFTPIKRAITIAVHKLDASGAHNLPRMSRADHHF